MAILIPRRVIRYGLIPALIAAEATGMAGEPMPRQLGEYQVKAAFLCNFARFVDWPPQPLQSPPEPFPICVLGQDPFGHVLDEVVAGQSVEGRPIEIRRIADPASLPACRVVFISPSQPKRAAAAATREPGVLTVGDSEAQNAPDTMITFTMDRGKVRFEVNIEAAGRGKLRLSSKLLSLATAIHR